MSASCGPALRYILAARTMRNKTASTARPAMTQTLENSNITTSLFTRPELFAAFFSPLNFFTCELVPLADVGHTFFVAADHHFGALFERGTIVTPRAGAAAYTVLLENDFPGAAGRDRNAHPADRTFVPVIPLVHLDLCIAQQPRHESEYDPAAGQPCRNGDPQAENRDQIRMLRQQVAGPAKPREKRQDAG